ncbi:hypothetical protein ROHU_017440 [Labeo rohita]|uniref:Uncharacterized protein n=1 Tax=Labeo rohita TaxID=84645 RepID=A0A498NG06_LABRO|nr:hypothetical protein ROHU_017440 [Labeo rohita]
MLLRWTSDLVDFNDDPGDDMQTNMQTDRQTECHTGMSCDSTHRFHKDHNETTVGGVSLNKWKYFYNMAINLRT